MNGLLLSSFVIVGVLYTTIGVLYFMKGNPGMGLAFIAYALANAGLFMGGG